MIVQSASADKQNTDITFSLGALDLDKAVDCLEAIKSKLSYQALVADPDMAKVSVIGTAMRSQPGIAQTMFAVLAEKGINLHVISTSEIKISVLIDTDYTELAVRSLHDAFGLETAWIKANRNFANQCLALKKVEFYIFYGIIVQFKVIKTQIGSLP